MVLRIRILYSLRNGWRKHWPMGILRCWVRWADTRKESSECLCYNFSGSWNNLTWDRLLEKFKVFTAFYHLNELRSREDLIKSIIENLDYSMYASLSQVSHLGHLSCDWLSDGHSRIILSKALTSSYKVSHYPYSVHLLACWHMVCIAHSFICHGTSRFPDS